MSYAPELLAAPQTARYEIVSFLGRGGTSLVYKARDVDKNFYVALKSVRFPEYEDIYRLKQEFRFFRDFYHPNLVALYDLHVEEASCFYTMELIEGLNLVSFVRAHPDLLRSCLDQLVDGLAALHEAGRLHRDLKPSNILVEPDGRTVLLDFGLSAEVRPGDSVVSRTQLYAGTPAYMAPEQLAGEPASVASDLYGLGVIMYEALTGRRPYPNLSPMAQYEAQATRPPPPHEIVSDLPMDLAKMALSLLSFEPRHRPPLIDVKRVTRTSSQLHEQTHLHHDRLGQLLVGRDVELARLQGALARTLAGHRVAVHVSGVSGVGKTTLVERFLADARSQVGALVLRSRCHHQESVRFNAVDGLIDMLSRYLMMESEERLARIAPSNLPALVTMFPVLGRVPFPFGDFDRDMVPRDPQSIVRQALDALRELLHGITAGRPLILWIDDLQWSDAGSLPLLTDIAIAGGDKPALLVFSYRTEDLLPNSVVAALERGIAANPDIETDHVDVQPLDASAVSTLVQGLVGTHARPDPDWVKEVAHQSAGLPFFVIELTAYRHSWPGGEDIGIVETSAAGVLDRRLRALPQPQRVVLEIVSVAGTPLLEETLVRITAHEAASGREIYLLLHQNLLRKADTEGRAMLETYHDRIRVAVLDSLDPAIRRLRHREIANEMARAADLNHPLLVEHFLGAGEPAIAAEHAILAARRAGERLAFDQAAEFLQLASRLRDPLDGAGSLAIELASALADAGRSAESGELFLRAAQEMQSEPEAAATYMARAAQQFLYSGRLTEGRDIYRKLFTDLGIAFPATVGAAARLSITNRALLMIGRRLKVRSLHENQAQALMRVDTLWAASKGFLMLDYVIGDAMFSCYMREAAALGERSRVLRALALEAAVLANVGRPWSIRRSTSLLQRAQDLGRDSTDPYDRVVLRTCQSGIAWFRGRWQEAADLAQEAITLHRRDCVRYDFELPIALAYRVSAMVLQGAIRQARTEMLEAIEDAQRRGDIYVSRLFKSGYSIYIALAEDSPDTAIADSTALLDDVPSDRFTSLHWSYFVATVNALVYAGRAWDAWSVVQQLWSSLRASGFLKLGCIGAHLREIRARAALSAAAAGTPPGPLTEWSRVPLLRVAEEDAGKIARTTALSHSAATAAAIRSGIAALQGDTDHRRVLLENACQGFGQAGMVLYRAAAELQLTTQASDGTNDDRSAAALQVMTDEGIRQPTHMSAFLMFA